MTVKDVVTVKDAAGASKSQPKALPGQAAEAAHMIGSTAVTGGVAIALTIIAIPVSLGMGLAWGVRSIARRVRGG